MCPKHCVAQAKADVELCCPTLPLNSRWHIQTYESQKPALLCPAWAALPASQCAPYLCAWQCLTQHSVTPRRLQTTSTSLWNLKFRIARSIDILRPETNCSSGCTLNPSVSQWWMVQINHRRTTSIRKRFETHTHTHTKQNHWQLNEHHPTDRLLYQTELSAIKVYPCSSSFLLNCRGKRASF